MGANRLERRPAPAAKQHVAGEEAVPQQRQRVWIIALSCRVWLISAAP